MAPLEIRHRSVRPISAKHAQASRFLQQSHPGSCPLASHAAWEEAGLPYEAELIDLTQNAQFSDAYRQKNPWARVPALQIGDDVLTENIAILNHIAELVPEKALLPTEGLARARALEWLALRLCCKDWRQYEVGCRSAPIRMGRAHV